MRPADIAGRARPDDEWRRGRRTSMNDAVELRSLLARVRRRWVAVTFLRKGGHAALAAAAPLLAGALAARLLSPAGLPLVALVTLALAAAIAAAAATLWPARRLPDDGEVARFVEEQAAGSHVPPVRRDALVTAVQVVRFPDRHPSVFAGLVVSQAVGSLRRIEPGAVVPAGLFRRASVHAAAGALVLAAAGGAALPYLVRAGATLWVALYPASISVDVLTGDARLRAGAPLRIVATVDGRGARLLSPVPTLVVSSGGAQSSMPMTPSGDGFAYEIDSVDRSFSYHVAAAGAVSSTYSVTALFPPRVQRIDAQYHYPSFTRLPVRDEPDAGDVYAPAGTRVRLMVHTDKPVAAGSLALASGPPVPLSAAGGRVATGELVVSGDDAYRLVLTDVDGLQGRGEVEYFIRVLDDRPPDVRIARPAADQGITPLEEVVIEARADDDHGIAHLELVYAVAGRAAVAVPFSKTTGTAVARVGTYLLPAEGLRVAPGDVITYYARARDVARGKRSTETRSDMYFLEVKPFNEEFVAAPSQAMGAGGAGTPLDGLVTAQKEIISATWNLERRSGAGRSAEDLRALGQAQAELKARIERMRGPARRGAGGLFPQQIAPGTGAPRAPSGRSDPIAAAVAAMERAVEELQQERTGEAIPHEMAALKGLLQAQAEIRRRQVMQQSASGAGQSGSNRSDRDLSALFDRELQRQQRTNYETPAGATRTPEQQDGSDAAGRLRELAARQEALAERQRELATTRLASEEMRRRLEMLTREQEELRKQVEELDARMRRPGAGGDAGKGGPSRNDPSADLRRAAEQMRSAAGEMRRQDGASAAERGQRAADALRRLERQMQGGSAESRRRRLGELQLDAQQIAEAQRRAAGEVSRLDQEQGGPDRDALRRLAAEKGRLADRIEALRGQLREAARDASAAEAAPLRQAGDQIDGEQIVERMRGSAQQLRERASGARAQGGPQTKPAPRDGSDVEAGLSRSLDSVVGRLGGKAPEAAGRLAEGLDRARDLRDRLNTLEEQVRALEAQVRAGAASQPGQRAGRGTPGRSAQEGRVGGQQTPGTGGGPSAAEQLQRARREYARELQRARESLRGERAHRGGRSGATPEGHEFSLSAPGNEGFKQDFTSWAALRKDVDLAIERYEAALWAGAPRPATPGGLSTGGSERVPDAYRPAVSRYFEAIAKRKQ